MITVFWDQMPPQASASPPNSRPTVCFLIPVLGPWLAVDVDERAETTPGASRSELTRRCRLTTSPRFPTGGIRLTPKLRNHIRHNVFGEMIGRVTAWGR